MVGKNNHTKMIHTNLKEHYKAYKVGRRWVFASLASLSLGAAMFLGSATTSYAETTDTATTPNTQNDSTATSATAATVAKTVTLTPSKQQAADSAAEKAESSATNVTASDSNSSNQPVSKNGTDATKQTDSTAIAASTSTDQKAELKNDVQEQNQSTKDSESNPGNNGFDDSASQANQVEVSTTDIKTAGGTVNDSANTSKTKVESSTEAKTTNARTQPAAQSKTAAADTVATKVDAAKVVQLESQLKSLLIDPSQADLTQVKTVASQLYALTGKPQQFAAVAGATQPSVTLKASTTKIGYGQPAGDVEIDVTMTVNNGDTITFTLPTNLDDLKFGSAQALPTGSGTSTAEQNSDGTYTVTDKFTQSGIVTQKINLSQRNNGDDFKPTPEQIGKEVTGNVTTTINGSPDAAATLTITQESKPSLAISNPTRVSPAPSKVTDVNGNVVKDANGDPVMIGDTVVPNTNYVYKFNVTDSKGIKNDSGDGIDKNLNTNGTTITIPVPTGFTLDGDLTNTLNGFTPTTATIKQNANDGNIVITVPANVKVGQGGIYLAGKYNNELTDTVQTLTASGNPTITQTIPGGQTLTATSTPWTEKLSAKDTGNAPAVGKVDVRGNSGNAPDKLTLDTDPTNDPQYLASYGYGVTSSTPVNDAKITLTIPDGVDATGVKLPDAGASKGGVGAAYLPGTTSYNYTITLSDGTTETGTVAAGGTINKTSTTSTVKQIVLQPNYLAAGATTGSNLIHLLGKLDSKYADGSAVKNGDGLNFQISIQVPGDDAIRSAKTIETIVNAQGRFQFYSYQGSKVPGAQNSGYISVCANGGNGQTTDKIYEPILYFVLPAETSIYQLNINGLDAAGNKVPNAGKISYYTTSTGQTGVKADFTGTGLSIDTSGTFNDQISLSNNADALPVQSAAYLYITSPTTPISNKTKSTDSTLVDGKTKADLSFTDGDANALVAISNPQGWTIDTAAATTAQSMAQGNQDPAVTNKGKSDARGNSELDFYTNLVNTAGAASDGSIAVNLPTAGDDQGSTYTFELDGPITVPANFTTATGTGASMTSTVLYGISRYTDAGTTPDTTGYVPANQVTDWSKIRSVIVKVGNVPTNTATGRIKLSGTAQNFVEQSGKIGYLQTTMYANGSAASVTQKAASIAITSTSTINARMHYKDDTGDHYIALTDLAKKLTDNKDKLNASDFPSTADKFTAADTALIPEGYHLVADPTDDSKLEVSIINSDHGDYGINEPNDTAAFGTTSKYYFDGDVVQYELSNKEELTVTYVDTDNNNQVVGTPETIQGQSNQTGTYTATVPTNYVLATGQPGTVDYAIIPGNADNITIKLAHEHTTDLPKGFTGTTKRTFIYTGVPDSEKPTTPAQTVTWTTDTDKVTGVTTYTPSGDYAAVTVPTVAGYTPNQTSVSVGANKVTTTQPQDTDVTINYTAGDSDLTVTYIDTDNNNQQVGTAETISGKTDSKGTYTAKVPTNYVLATGQPGTVNYTITADTKDNIVIKLAHQHTTDLPQGFSGKTQRTFTYTGMPDSEKPTTPAQTVTWTTDTDKVTGITTYTPSGNYAPVTVPNVPGYTPDKSSIPVGTNSVTTKKPTDTNVSVNYTAGDSDLEVTYIDTDNNNQQVGAIDKVTGKTDTAGTYTAKVPTNYVLATGQAGSIAYTIKADDTDNIVIKLAHQHTTALPEGFSGKTKRTFTFTGIPDSKKPSLPVQTVTWATDTDKVTGITTYTPSGSYAAVTVPNVTGYTTNQASVPVGTNSVTTTTPKDINVPIIYTAGNADLTVTYIDTDNNNQQVGIADTVSGKTDGTGTYLATVPTHYVLAQGQAGSVNYTLTPDDSDNIVIKLAHKHTSDLPKGFTGKTQRTVVYTGVPDNEKPQTPAQPIAWTTDTDEVTGVTTYTPSGDYPAITVPDVPGYTTKTTSIPVEPNTVTTTTPTDKTVTVTYTAGDSDLTVTYIDVDNNDQQVGAAVTVSSKTDSAGTYTAEVPTNYVLATGQPSTVNYTVKADNSDNIVIKLAHQHTTDLPKGFTGKTIRTITYTGVPANKTPSTPSQTVIWTTDTDKVTGITTYTPSGNYTAVTVPNVPGYTADKTSVPVGTNKVTTTTPTNTIETVTYTADDADLTVTYIDIDNNNQQVGSAVTVNGKTDGTGTYMATVPEHYVLAQGQANSVAYTLEPDNSDNIVIKLAHKHTSELPKGFDGKTTRTIIFTGVPTNEMPQTPVQKVTWTTDTDEVTGTTIYTPSGKYPGISVPNVPGYTAEVTRVSDVSNTPTTTRPNNITTTVAYTPNSSKMTFIFVDDVENGKVVEGTTLDGVVDQTGQFNVIVPNGYELSKNQKGNIDYKFTPDEAQNKITIHLVHGIAHTTTTTIRTINYYIQGTTTPVHEPTVQTLTWNVETDEVTGESVATPQGGYSKVTSPIIPGYTADNTSVDGQYPKPVAGKSGENLTATVYYTPNPNNGGGVTPPDTPETTPTTPNAPETNNTTDGGTTVPNHPENGEVPRQPNGKTTGNGRTPNQSESNNVQTTTQANGGMATNGSGNVKVDASGQFVQPTSAQASGTVQSAKINAVSSGSTKKLPQTNEQTASAWSALGIGLMSIMSLLGLAKRKKHGND